MTFIFFFILIVFAYAADKYGPGGEDEEEEEGETKALIEYTTVDFYKTLIEEKNGNAPQDKESVDKR